MSNNKDKVPLRVVRKSNQQIFESHNRLVTTKMGQVEKLLPKDICRVLDVCGSCSLLNKDYKSQLLEKTARIKSKFKELGGFFSHIVVQNFVESDSALAYRQSIKLVVSEHFVGGKPWIDIGFYRQSLNKVVDIGNCPIQSSTLNDVMYYLRSALKNFKIPIYTPIKKNGLLCGLILRSSKATKQIFVTFLVRELKPTLFRELACALIEKLPNVQGVFLQLEDASPRGLTAGSSGIRLDPAVKPRDDSSTEFVLLAGTNIIEEKFGLLKFKLTNEVELPIHPLMTAKIYARVLELCDLTGTQTLLHLYSGMGVLSCLLAQKARLVYALDEKPVYIKNIELNLKLHKINNVQVEVGKIAHTLSSMPLTNCDVAVVSSPRNGCGLEMIKKLAGFSAKNIIYTSSFNEHMIDDLKYFAQNNYRPVFVEPFDTHPGTPYFEVLCYLQYQSDK
jgi:23S rRNA (uracil1939-C5)-methyltransferase